MSISDLRRDLERIDGRSYGFYRDLVGRRYRLGPCELFFDHVQPDPFAPPSRLQLRIPREVLALPPWALAGRDARRAAADFLHRRLRGLLTERGHRGTRLEVAPLGPEVLERTAVVIDPVGAARVRLVAGLPAAGRRILAAEAERLFEALCAALERAIDGLDCGALRFHVQVVEDQVALRASLAAAGLLAFVAEGSCLPRRAGNDERPLPNALPLEVPDSLACELEAPHAGKLRGLAIPRGVTLIAGGGYHGKSTLLRALALGVYDHVPGDGRERCVSAPALVAVRAEDGRSVRGVDLRPFIGNLPLGRPAARFETDDASGSTSQAAAIVEALEAGASGLLIDEDTAASNFMIRDARMRRLVPREAEPITPFIDRVRQLWEERGVSSAIVAGGAGDYLEVADRVIQMEGYQPRDATRRAREVMRELPLGEAAPRSPGPWPAVVPRVPLPESLDARRGTRAERVRGVRTRSIEFGREEIHVSLLGQLVDAAQCRAIGDALLQLARGLCDGRRSLAQLLDALEAGMDAEGLEAVAAPGFGDRARPRRFEIAAALNRLRSLRVAI